MPASDILSPAEVDELRALVVDLGYPDTFEIVRNVEVNDGAGGKTVTPAVIASGPCRLELLSIRSAQMAILAGTIQDVIPIVVHLPFGTDVKPRDTITINGKKFIVQSPVSLGNWSMESQAVVKEVL